jgi:hypothetical protein
LEEFKDKIDDATKAEIEKELAAAKVSRTCSVKPFAKFINNDN